jgi:hypothetical protein
MPLIPVVNASFDRGRNAYNRGLVVHDFYEMILFDETH